MLSAETAGKNWCSHAAWEHGKSPRKRAWLNNQTIQDNALAAAALLPVTGGVFCQVVLGRRENLSEEKQTP